MIDLPLVRVTNLLQIERYYGNSFNKGDWMLYKVIDKNTYPDFIKSLISEFPPVKEVVNYFKNKDFQNTDISMKTQT